MAYQQVLRVLRGQKLTRVVRKELGSPAPPSYLIKHRYPVSVAPSKSAASIASAVTHAKPAMPAFSRIQESV
eukprot:10805552-Lingulodinium_polyedra.AAC.1